MGTELTKVTFPDTNYIDLNHRVSNVAWDSTNKKLTQTFGETTTDIVTGETILDPLIPVKTASGSLVSFNDGADLPMPSFICNIDAVQDLHGYDHPWVGGAGKNLWNGAWVTTALNNEYYGQWQSNYIPGNMAFPVIPGNSYTFSVNGTATLMRYGWLDSEMNLIGNLNNAYTVTAPENAYYLRWRWYGDGSTESGDLSNSAQLELGSTATAFAPYSNICPISGHTGVDAWVRGKNLFDKNANDVAVGYYLNASTGGISPSQSGYNTSGYIPIEPNTYYTKSGASVSADEYCFYDSEKTFISGLSRTETTVLSPNNAAYMRFDYRANETDNIQIEIGSTATTYEPYNPNSQTIQVSWQTEAGEVFGGYVDLVSGELTVDRMGVTYSNTDRKYNDAFRLYPAPSNALVANADNEQPSPLFICDKFKFISISKVITTKAVNVGIGISKTSTSFYIKDTAMLQMTLEEAQTYLSSHPIDVVYPLATHITYQLTPTQIKSLLGNNNAWCDTGDVNVKYTTQPYDGISAKYSEYAYNAVNKTGDTITGDLTLYMEGTTANNYPTSLIFKNKNTTTGNTSTGYFQAYEGGVNGINFMISPGGNMFIGSGESASAHYNLYKHSTTEMFFATADQHMYLQANGQTIANRRGLVINASHEILPCAADVATNNIGSIGNSTYKWGSVYATNLYGSLTGDISGGTGLTSTQVTTALGYTPPMNNTTFELKVRNDGGVGIYETTATSNKITTTITTRPSYWTCDTAAATVAKTTNLMPSLSGSDFDFKLYEGVTIYVKFDNSNTATNPTLSVNGTTAKPIKRVGVAPGKTPDTSWTAGSVIGFTYDGTNWNMNDITSGIHYIEGPSTDTTEGTWTGSDSSIKAYYDGLTIIYVPAVKGASTTTLNINGLGAKTCYFTNTSKLTTHFSVGTPIMFTYKGGYWRRADYDANTNTQIRVYRQTTGYNNDYPLLVSRTLASGIGTTGTNDSYSQVYGVMWNDTTKIPTLNPNTGEIKAVKFTGDISSGTGLTSTQVTTALGFTPGTSNLTLGTTSTTALKGDTKYAGSSSAGGAATSAAKLTNTSKIGDINKPVYFTASGVPSAISYTINKSVPSTAVFTDTTYTISTGTNVGQIKVTPSSDSAYDVDVKGFGDFQRLEVLHTSGSSASLPGSTFIANGRRGYLFIVFNSKTPSSSNRAVACIPMIAGTVYYVPFVVGTSYKSARFELQAVSGGGNGININFLSISDSNFGVEAIWG